MFFDLSPGERIHLGGGVFLTLLSVQDSGVEVGLEGAASVGDAARRDAPAAPNHGHAPHGSLRSRPRERNDP